MGLFEATESQINIPTNNFSYWQFYRLTTYTRKVTVYSWRVLWIIKPVFLRELKIGLEGNLPILIKQNLPLLLTNKHGWSNKKVRKLLHFWSSWGSRHRHVGLKNGNVWSVFKAAWHLVTVTVEQDTVNKKIYLYNSYWKEIRKELSVGKFNIKYLTSVNSFWKVLHFVWKFLGAYYSYIEP